MCWLLCLSDRSFSLVSPSRVHACSCFCTLHVDGSCPVFVEHVCCSECLAGTLGAVLQKWSLCVILHLISRCFALWTAWLPQTLQLPEEPSRTLRFRTREGDPENKGRNPKAQTKANLWSFFVSFFSYIQFFYKTSINSQYDMVNNNHSRLKYWLWECEILQSTEEYFWRRWLNIWATPIHQTLFMKWYRK